MTIRTHFSPSDFSPLHGNQGDRELLPVASGPAGLTVAISREVGARGVSIAKRVARKLGWQVYTREHLEFLCANETVRQQVLSDLPIDVSRWVEEQLHRVETDSILQDDVELGPLPRLLFTLASRGQVVIVGRGAGYLLPKESTLHVRIISPLEERINYMAQLLRLSHHDAEKAVRHREEQRTEFLLWNFERDRMSLTDFDLILNSARLGEDSCVELISTAVSNKESHLQTPSDEVESY